MRAARLFQAQVITPAACLPCCFALLNNGVESMSGLTLFCNVAVGCMLSKAARIAVHVRPATAWCVQRADCARVHWRARYIRSLSDVSIA